jgi:hypothetical protein
VPKKLLETQPTDVQIKPDFKLCSYATSGLIQNLENLEEITESTILRDIPMFLSWGGIPQILTPKLKLLVRVGPRAYSRGCEHGTNKIDQNS